MEGKRNTIGVLVNSFTDIYTTTFAKGIIAGAWAYDYELCFYAGRIFSENHPGFTHDNCIFSEAAKKEHDGLIILRSSISTFCNDIDWQTLLDKFAGIPKVLAGESSSGIPHVYTDNFTAMYQLTFHLVKEHNCKRIAFLSGPMCNGDMGPRYEGYKAALNDCGIQFDNTIVAEGDFDAVFCKEAITRLFNGRRDKIDAVMCANDNIAINAYNCLKRLGIKIPEDIILTGFDNIADYERCPISITTVSQDVEKVGSEAFDLLKNLIEQTPTAGQSGKKEIPYTIEFGQSCGCRKSGNRIACSRGAEILHELDMLQKYNRGILRLRKQLSSVATADDFEKVLAANMPDLGICGTSVLLNFNPGKDRKRNNHKPSYLNIVQGVSHECKTGMDDSVKFRFSLSDYSRVYGKVTFCVKRKELLNEKHVLYFSCGFFDDLIREIMLTIIRLTGSKYNNQKPVGAAATVLPENMAKHVYTKLLNIMDTRKPYIDHELSLHKLSQELNLSRNKLSYVINNFAGKSFYQFINQYRIRTAKDIMQKSPAGSQKILDIACNSGFRSKATFNKVFRELTRMSPSEYKNNCIQNK